MSAKSTEEFVLLMQHNAKRIIKEDDKAKRETARLERLQLIGGNGSKTNQMGKSGTVPLTSDAIGSLNMTMKEDAAPVLNYSIPMMTVGIDTSAEFSSSMQRHSSSASNLNHTRKSTSNLSPIKVPPNKSKVLRDLKKSPLFPSDGI